MTDVLGERTAPLHGFHKKIIIAGSYPGDGSATARRRTKHEKGKEKWIIQFFPAIIAGGLIKVLLIIFANPLHDETAFCLKERQRDRRQR